MASYWSDIKREHCPKPLPKSRKWPSRQVRTHHKPRHQEWGVARFRLPLARTHSLEALRDFTTSTFKDSCDSNQRWNEKVFWHLALFTKSRTCLFTSITSTSTIPVILLIATSIAMSDSDDGAFYEDDDLQEEIPVSVDHDDAAASQDDSVVFLDPNEVDQEIILGDDGEVPDLMFVLRFHFSGTWLWFWWRCAVWRGGGGRDGAFRSWRCASLLSLTTLLLLVSHLEEKQVVEPEEDHAVSVFRGHTGTLPPPIILAHSSVGEVYCVAVTSTSPCVVASGSGDDSAALWKFSYPSSEPSMISLKVQVIVFYLF